MPEIQIHVKNKVPEIVGDIKYIIADNSDYSIRFIFDELWDNGEKTVYFIRSNGYVFPPAKTSNETVSVPVQKDVPILSWLHIGVQQGNIKTSCPCDVKLFPSAASYIKDDAVQPAGELWNYVLARLSDVEEAVTHENLSAIVKDYFEKNPVDIGVASVNGKTGDVTLSAAEVGALPASVKIPEKTSDLENDSGFITRVVSDLANYYAKSQLYTREEIDQRISAVPKFAISVVSALPVSGISTTTVYLVKSGTGGDLYTEYIYVGGKWEILGSQRVDLSGYATEAWVNLQLEDYLTADKLTAAIIKGALGYTPADSEDVTSLADTVDAQRADVDQLSLTIADYDIKKGASATRKPFVTFTVDDGSSKDITILKPIFVKYGVPCCPALICGDNWDVNNLEERLDLQANHNWEYMCHGVDEIPFNQKTTEQVEAEIIESKTKLKTLGFNIKDIAYPLGASLSSDGDTLRPIVSKYFRAGYGFNPHPTIKPNTGILDSCNIHRVPLGSFTYSGTDYESPEYYKSLEYYKDCVDYAVSNNAWCIFCLHSAAADFDETQQQHLDDLIAYIQSIGVSIGNLTEGYEIFGNYIECGAYKTGFQVTNSGENNIPVCQIKDFTPRNSDLLTAFPMNKVTVAEFGHNGVGLDFPNKNVGMVFTARFENQGFQIVVSETNNTVYKRIWNDQNNTWKAWQVISGEYDSDRTFSKLFSLGQGASDSFAISITSRLFIRTFQFTNNSATITLNKQYFNKSEISTSKSNPTIIGMTSDGAEIQMYYQSGGWLCFKVVYADSTQLPASLNAYMEIAYK